MGTSSSKQLFVSGCVWRRGNGAQQVLVTFYGGTALHAAAAHGHVGAVTSLLQRGAKPNIVDAAGCTPLHLAILHRHEDCVGQLLVSLLASGAVRASARRLDLGSPATAFEAASGEGVQDASTTPCTPFYSMADNMGNVPLLLAAEMNLPSTLGLLLDAGAPPDTDRHPFTGDTALHIAAEQGNEQCLRILLERGASPAIANESGQVPLHRAAAAAPAPEGATAQGRQGHFGECVTALLEADAGSAVAKNNSSATPVDVACRCDAGRDVPGAAAAALVASASLEALSGPSHQNSGTALHSAVFHGRAGILQALLDRGVPPDSRSGLGDSALHLAAERGAAALIPLLAHAHANVNIQGLKHKKATPLHIAAKGDQVQALQALLAAGAAVDATDRDGSTALHYAAAAGARRALRVLLTDGQADPETENLAGHTALHFARKLRSKPCIAMLTDPSSVTPFGGKFRARARSMADVAWAQRNAVLICSITGKNLQAKLDFQKAAYLAELYEMHRALMPVEEIYRLQDEVYLQCSKMEFGQVVQTVNERLTTQLSELYQHLADIDAGDMPVPASIPTLPHGTTTAADTPSIGPSTHTNPEMTLDMHVKISAGEQEKAAKLQQRQLMLARTGFALWLGPTQAPTPSHSAGVFLRGRALPGQVVGVFPGAVYNSEMRQKAVDFGHFANPAVQRIILPRFDDTILDVHGAGADVYNPLAVAHHARHPPAGVTPNVMRLQYDYVDDENSACLHGLVADHYGHLDFPRHLRPYIPNKWGSLVTGAQTLHSALEHGIYMKGMVLVATREVLDEELFVDHRLNPYTALPAWYRPLDLLAAQRTWMQVAGKGPEDAPHPSATAAGAAQGMVEQAESEGHGQRVLSETGER
ncbi:ankrd52 [Symbiodinium sp. KB8]|nr:ankrd52 [Symbiodinium sp. KB8]